MALISFTPLQDGVTGVNAAATNTPLQTIYNDYNGNITDANIASNAAIAGSKISASSLPIGSLVSTQANAGTAGGTMSYLNLGGFKGLWCISANQNSGSSPATYTFTLPTSFFSTITLVEATAINMTSTANQFASVVNATATTISVAVTAPAGGSNTTGISLFVIGT